MASISDLVQKFGVSPTFFTSAANSATLGGSRKIEAGLAAAWLKLARDDPRAFKELYQQGLQAAPQLEEEQFRQNPAQSIGGALAGGSVLPWKATSLAGGAATGAGYGAAAGLLSNTHGDVGQITGHDIGAALSGAPAGAAFGVVGQGLSNAIGKRVGASPEMTKDISLFEKNNVPYKKSDITGAPLDVLAEENTLIGEHGSSSRANLQQFNKNQRDAFGTAQENLHNNILGNPESALGEAPKFTEKGELASNVIGDLQKNALAERAPINEAYDVAKQAVGRLDIKEVNKFPALAQEMLQSPEVSLSKANAPKAYQQLNAFKDLFGKTGDDIKAVDFRGLETWRQGLNKAITGIEKGGQDEVGVNVLKRTFDDWIENNIEKALVEGDSTVLDKFKEARGLSRDWMEKYGGNSKDVGKNFVREMVENARNNQEPLTPEIIVNKIFGTSELGFNNQAASIIKELKNHIPEDALAKLRIEGGARLLKPLTKETPNALTYTNNLNKFLKENHSLASELFTKNQIGELKDFGNLAHKIYGSKVNSNLNPSKSGLRSKLEKVVKKNSWISELIKGPVVLNQEKLKSGLLKGEKLSAPLNKFARGAVASQSQQD